ncbi:GNAT family N-acetyltransferase [Paenibacillus antri]|uniref:GNAT family N-acetyltransferase n=1 Tax=Paenibacillus antri TaxID=2582848 RepID=UPI001305462F|nr:GNAT family N-acetyltransferase [Paenibacillus antri]
MALQFTTLAEWDSEAWRAVEPIFDEAFPPSGRKTSRMIRKIVDTDAGWLHIGAEDGEAVAMAVTGKLPELRSLLIDYVAVRSAARSRGIGRRMAEFLAEEARRLGFDGLVIEIEAEETPSNESRERFWTSLGFRRTEYVHRYRWVPETYRALYMELGGKGAAALPHDGEALFRGITGFHGKIWRD